MYAECHPKMNSEAVEAAALCAGPKRERLLSLVLSTRAIVVALATGGRITDELYSVSRGTERRCVQRTLP